MSAKEQDHRDFLNSLRERLNVDDKTILNLEKRITGKLDNSLISRPEKWAVHIFKKPYCGRWRCENSSPAHGKLFAKIVFSRARAPLGTIMLTEGFHGPNHSLTHF